MQAPDLTIGQRLALGFGAPLALLATFLCAMFAWDARLEHQQQALVARLGPVSEATLQLQRSLQSCAVAMRDYLLVPDSSHLAAGQAQLAVARAAQGALETLPPHTSGRARAPVDGAVEAYLQRQQKVLAHGARPDALAEQLDALSEARNSALRALDQLRAAQLADFTEAMSQMDASRDRLHGELIGGGLLTLLLIAAAALWMSYSLRLPVQQLLAGANAIEDGDWTPALRWASLRGPAPRDEVRRLARALGAAAAALQRRDRRVQADRKIAEAAAGSLDAERITGAALAAVVEKMRAALGLVYFSESGGDLLAPVATFAAGAATPAIRVGEGLAGQAARERRRMVLREIPPDAGFRVRLGHDEAPPRCVAAAPIMFGGSVLGVIVVGALHEFDDYSLSFLDSAAAQLAAGLQNSLAHAQLRRLAQELHDKNRHIQAQAEAVQAQNEEFQAQGEELQAQSEEIHSQNEQLRELTDQLSLADSRKNDFLAVLAHELRNPLAAISNSLHVLSHAQLDREVAESTRQVIARQTRQLTRLIDDLLDITRIVRGTLQIHRESLDLTALLRDCLDDLRPAVDQAGMTIKPSLPGGPLRVSGDRTRLSQVVSNLVGNAIKYRHDGGTIEVSLDQAGGEAVLRVADDGIGIDSSFLPRVFEPFAQAGSGPESNGGLGLGLSVVKALVEAHGGSIEAHSRGQEQGALFTVRLPLKRRQG